MPDLSDKAIAILRRTSDGDELAPEHLALVQAAVNGGLTDKGVQALDDLHTRCQLGYTPPWLHGIEHLTVNLSGYVFWKGSTVEHYDRCLWYSERGRVAAEELASRCRWLETRGHRVNTTTAVWQWPPTEYDAA